MRSAAVFLFDCGVGGRPGSHPRRELQDLLALRDDEHFRKAYLQPALEKGLIEMTIPEKPNSRLQRYRLTPKGTTLVKALSGKGRT